MQPPTLFLSSPTTVKILLILTIILLVTLGFGGYHFYKLSKKLAQTQLELATTTVQMQSQIDTLTGLLTAEQRNKAELSGALTSEQAKNADFVNQITQIQGTVGVLVKLHDTDPELLKKYSKVYFLSENYIPAGLTFIDSQFLWNPNTPIQSQSQVLSFLQNMLTASKNVNVNIQVVSGYRSFNEQASLKNTYKVTYGSGANKFSADQGYSEHQLGSAFDLTTTKIGGNLVGFDKTDAYTWLLGNAYKYGFVISYPKANTYYIFEPWHWRFVGVELATKLHDDNRTFYDLDQRLLDTYLIGLFDYP